MLNIVNNCICPLGITSSILNIANSEQDNFDNLLLIKVIQLVKTHDA